MWACFIDTHTHTHIHTFTHTHTHIVRPCACVSLLYARVVCLSAVSHGACLSVIGFIWHKCLSAAAAAAAPLALLSFLPAATSVAKITTRAADTWTSVHMGWWEGGGLEHSFATNYFRDFWPYLRDTRWNVRVYLRGVFITMLTIIEHFGDLWNKVPN